ncbi:putative transposable element [Trichonephila clavipes]|nr:putative transposable element [Trichonephila clavipes]
MSVKTEEKRRKRYWYLYLMLRKGRDKAWITSDEAQFHLSFATGKTKSQKISSKKRRKHAAVLKNASWPLGVMFGLAIHQNDHQARRRFVEWAQNEIAVVPDFHKQILISNEVHFWLNGYVNKQNCRIWSEANPQVYVETPLHPEKLTVWCALWAGGILLQKR